jgi:hypothetical protein
MQSVITLGLRGVILFDFKENLHDIRTHVSYFGKDAAHDTQSCGTQGFANIKLKNFW